MFLDNFQLRLDKPEKIKERKAFGGHKKTKGIKIKTGLYAWNSLGIHSSFVLLYVAYLPTIDLLPPTSVDSFTPSMNFSQCYCSFDQICIRVFSCLLIIVDHLIHLFLADVEFECPILKVVHNTANDNFTKNGVMVKGTIVEIDSNPFKTWLVLKI